MLQHAKNIINKRSFATNQKQNVSDLPNPNNAREDACKQEFKRSNKYEEARAIYIKHIMQRK